MSVNQKIDKLTKPQLIELSKKMNSEVCIKTGNLSRKDLQDTIKQMNNKIKVNGRKMLDNIIPVPGRGKDLEREAKLGEAKRQRKLKQIAPKASPEEINTIFAVYFGIGYSPYVGEKEIKIFTGYIRNIFQSLK